MRKSQVLALLALIVGILLLIFWIPIDQALSKGEVRAAMDIGSGATNLKVAKVDPQTNKITVQLFEKSIPVPYQKHLEQSSNNTFDQQVTEQGIRAIKALKEIADSYGAKKVVAIATAAFRKAANAQQVAQEIERQTGVQVRIIDQDEEGILAFRGALALSSAEPQQAVVWDIGGGSMQLTALSPQGTYLVDKGKTASIPFKNAVIQNIEGKDLNTTQSPNPMTLQQMQAAINYASQLAQQTDPFIKSKLTDANAQVLAVGNLFNFGIKTVVDDAIVKQNALENVIKGWAGKTDADLPGEKSLTEVAVTNPLLVLGYMKGLNIQQVEVIDVNNADGALTYPAYWE